MSAEASFGLREIARALDIGHQLFERLKESGFYREDIQALQEFVVVREDVLEAIRNWALRRVKDALRSLPYVFSYTIWIHREIPAFVSQHADCLDQVRIKPNHYASRNITSDIVWVEFNRVDGQYFLAVRISPDGDVSFDLFLVSSDFRVTKYIDGGVHLQMDDLASIIQQLVDRQSQTLPS